MNIKDANSIPISSLLDTLNIKPSKTRGKELYYLSPIRNEKTPSFHVNTEKNEWYDHGIGEGGDVVKLACRRLQFLGEDHNVSDALRWIKNISGSGLSNMPERIQKTRSATETSFIISKIGTIQDNGLAAYLDERGIARKLAGKYLKELRIFNKKSKKYFVALGLENEEGGFELRNKFFKGSIGTKDITFIRGKDVPPQCIHIFEGMMDFLSVVSQEEDWQFHGDAIVLNSLACIKKATPYIKNYGYRFAYTWLDNDKAGHEGSKALADFFTTEQDARHKPMNDIYRNHKDVNDWHKHQLKLSL